MFESLLDPAVLRPVLTFLAGALTVIAIAYFLRRSDADLTSDGITDYLDAIEGHKDELTVGLIVISMCGRSIILPNELWVQLVETGELTMLAISVGAGVGITQFGRAYRDKVNRKVEESAEPNKNQNSS